MHFLLVLFGEFLSLQIQLVIQLNLALQVFGQHLSVVVIYQHNYLFPKVLATDKLVYTINKEIKNMTRLESLINLHNLLFTLKNKIMLRVQVPLEPQVLG